MTATTATVRFIGKCSVKGCKHVVRADDSATIREAWTRGGHWAPIEGEPRCSEHPRLVLRWRRIQGTHNPHKGCNARCEGATGPSCECECGGENHGGRWSL